MEGRIAIPAVPSKVRLTNTSNPNNEHTIRTRSPKPPALKDAHLPPQLLQNNNSTSLEQSRNGSNYGHGRLDDGVAETTPEPKERRARTSSLEANNEESARVKKKQKRRSSKYPRDRISQAVRALLLCFILPLRG
jgi:hypothetical protein